MLFLKPPGLLVGEVIVSAWSMVRDGVVTRPFDLTALLAGLGFRLFLALPFPRFKQPSKQSSQHGRPSTSTIGRVETSLMHPSHLKHLECQTRPSFSTNPPSTFSRRTSLPQASHGPLLPPFSVKQGRQKYRFVSPSSAGYIVASGRNGASHALQTKDAREETGWRTEP